jgi:hypothetical protein
MMLFLSEIGSLAGGRIVVLLKLMGVAAADPHGPHHGNENPSNVSLKNTNALPEHPTELIQLKYRSQLS